MARNRFGLQFSGWEDYIEKLDKVGGSAAMKRGVENALKESKKHVNKQIEKSMQANKLPAKGQFATGKTAQSIDKSEEVDWKNLKATMKVGFEFEKSGLTSIFLMYGTPRMRPAKGLKAAIYGGKVNKEIQEIQKKEILDEINRIMNGGG